MIASRIAKRAVILALVATLGLTAPTAALANVGITIGGRWGGVGINVGPRYGYYGYHAPYYGPAYYGPPAYYHAPPHYYHGPAYHHYAPPYPRGYYYVPRGYRRYYW